MLPLTSFLLSIIIFLTLLLIFFIAGYFIGRQEGKCSANAERFDREMKKSERNKEDLQKKQSYFPGDGRNYF